MQAIQIGTAIVVCVLVTAGCQWGQSTASSQLQELFDDAWEFRLRENPLFATTTGDRRYNDRLGRVSLADSHRRAKREKEFLNRLNAIDPSRLSDRERINYDIFKRLKQDTLAEYDHFSYLIPLTSRSGLHTEFPKLPEQVPLKTVSDYENYIRRLRAFKAYVDGHIELMRAGVAKGYVLPRVVLEGVPETIEPLIVNDEYRHPFALHRGSPPQASSPLKNPRRRQAPAFRPSSSLRNLAVGWLRLRFRASI